jgi:hypothetical protein
MRRARQEAAGCGPPEEVEAVVRGAFEEVALLIGGAAAGHRLADALVWSLLRRLERVRGRALDRLRRQRAGQVSTSEGGPVPVHPAVEAFLLRNRSAGARAAAPVASDGEARGGEHAG